MSARSCGALQPGESLFPGESLPSCNGETELVYQTDGNVVLYQTSDRRALWNAGSNGLGTAGQLTMQVDGNLVAYGADGAHHWNAGVVWHGGALAVQNDGNTCIYSPEGTALWCTRTRSPCGGLRVGDRMLAGEIRWNCSSTAFLALQVDGNLVLYRASTREALWSSNTRGTTPGFATLQTDGNFVLYDANGGYMWDTGTSNRGDLVNHAVALRDDGVMCIERNAATSPWCTRRRAGDYRWTLAERKTTSGCIFSVGDTACSDVAGFGGSCDPTQQFVRCTIGHSSCRSRSGPSGFRQVDDYRCALVSLD